MAREELYIQKYKSQWELLENYIKRFGKKNNSRFTTDELKEYLRLMKSVSHHLAYVKTHFPESSLYQYLNDLSVRAHNNLYVVKKSSWQHIKSYITKGFALSIHENKNYILLSLFVFLVGIIFSSILTINNPQNASFFVPQELVQQKDWSFSSANWQEEQFSFLSSYVMTNNIGVAIKSFVFGITAGVLTIYVLFVNGGMLGALTTLVFQNSPNVINFLALILPHGIIELAAIIISGGAGLRIGKSLLIPGEYKRKDSLIKESKIAVTLMPGVVVMLIIAGLTEGFFTPARIPVFIKLTYAGITALLLCLYILIPRKQYK